MENNLVTDTGEDDVFWNKVNDVVDKIHDDLAENMRGLYANSPTVTIATMEEFTAGNFKVGDLLIAGESGDQSTWIVVHPEGKCLLLAGQETEDVDWFFRFGSVDIIRVPN